MRAGASLGFAGVCVTFFPRLTGEWATEVERVPGENLADHVYEGVIALIDADTGVALRLYAFRGGFSQLLI